MNTQTETKKALKAAESPPEAENPMQERHCNQVVESVEETAETVLTARKLEACAERDRSIREAAGPVFVP
jgi:hypothetical protein